MVRIEINNQIRLSGLTVELKEKIKSLLTIKNPEYEKKLRMGFYIGRTPKTLELFVVVGYDLIVPYGMKSYIMALLKDIPFEVIETHAENPIKLVEKEPLTMYDYQDIAVKSVLKHTNGILVSPTGSGKTRMGIKIIQERSVRTLWVTHTLDLLKQSMNVYKKFFKNKPGVIASGKIDIQDVTFATVQTLHRIDLSLYRDKWEQIIFDECHKIAGTPTRVMMFYKVATNLNSKYKYGLTATLYDKKNDVSQTPLFVLGDKLHEIKKEDISRINAKYMPINLSTETSDSYLNPDKTINHHLLTEYLVYNAQRNNEILNNLIKCKSRYNLILSNRNGHLDILSDYLEVFGFESYILKGDTKAVDREFILDKFRAGKINFLLSNYQLAKEGLDLPIADTLHLIMPMRDRITIEQSKGRVERTFKGKESAFVYDYIDYKIGTLAGMSKVRRRYLI